MRMPPALLTTRHLLCVAAFDVPPVLGIYVDLTAQEDRLWNPRAAGEVVVVLHDRSLAERLLRYTGGFAITQNAPDRPTAYGWHSLLSDSLPASAQVRRVLLKLTRHQLLSPPQADLAFAQVDRLDLH